MPPHDRGVWTEVLRVVQQAVAHHTHTHTHAHAHAHAHMGGLECVHLRRGEIPPPDTNTVVYAFAVGVGPSMRLYVGESDNVAQRFDYWCKQHKQDLVAFAYFPLPRGQGGKSLARRIEAHAIRMIAPKFPLISKADGHHSSFGA